MFFSNRRTIFRKFSAALERDYLNPWPAGTAEARFKERFEKLARN